MHFFKVVGVVTASVATVGAVDENLGCSSGGIVTVTSINTVTKTVAADSQFPLITSTAITTVTKTVAETVTIAVTSSSAASPIFSSTPAIDEEELSTLSNGVTGTSVIFETWTNFVTVGGAAYTSSTKGIQASLTSSLAIQGPYYFSVHNDTTIWLGGKTPPAMVSYDLAITTVLVLPVPSSTATSSMVKAITPNTVNMITSSTVHINSTSTQTIQLTRIIPGKTVTYTLTEATPSSSTLTRGFTGIGTYGWNSSATTHREGMTRGSESGTYATGVANIPFGFLQASYSASVPVSSSSPLVSSGKMKIKRVPQVGAIITASINGVVVSWTNNYDGSSPATSTPVSSSSGASFSLTTPPSPTLPVTPTTVAESLISSSCEETATPTPTSSSLVPYDFTVTSLSTTLPAQAIPFGPPSIRHSRLSTISLKPLPSTGSTFSPRFTTSVVPPYSNASTTLSAAATSASSICTGLIRNSGNFTIDFDDLPKLSASPNTTNYPPIFSTYHKLFWANGFAYVPPPKDPYLPISSPQLAVFITDPTANVHADNSTVGLGEEGYGEFGAGPRYAESAYWIDAYSAYVGCNNTGPAECMITINGYTYEPHFKNVVLNALQVVYQPPCPTLTNCDFLSVTLNNDFRNLVGLQIVATVGEERVAWFMDDLEVGWSNNTCASDKQRDSSRER